MRRSPRGLFIRKLCERLLEKHQVETAPVPVEALAREEGLEVHSDPQLHESLNGFLHRPDDDTPVVILQGAEGETLKRRFTLACQLGHYLLHHGESYLSERQEGITFARLGNRGSADVERIEAYRFAQEILMPQELVERAFNGLPRVLDEEIPRLLASEFEVGEGAMKLRLLSLGYADVGCLYDAPRPK